MATTNPSLNNNASSTNTAATQPSQTADNGSDTILGGATDMVYSAGQSTKDTVEKGVQYLQETMLGQSSTSQPPEQKSTTGQANQASHQAVDNMDQGDVEEFIRGKYHSKAGEGLPLAEKAEGK